MSKKDIDLQKRALRYLPTVADAFIYDPKTGDLILTAFANTDTSVEIAMNTTDKLAGVGGAKLFSINSERTVNVTLTTIDFRLEYFAVNLGQTVQIGNIDVQSSKEQYTAADGVIVLKNPPADGKISLETADGYITVNDITDTTVDLSDYGIENDCVSVIYVYVTPARYVNIASDTAPLTAKLVLSTPMYDNKIGKIGSVQYVFPSFQFSGNINSSLTSSDSGTIEMSGSPNASDGNACGAGTVYGTIVEILDDTSSLMTVSGIALQPNEIELAVGEKVTLQLFGLKGSEVIYSPLQLDVADGGLTSSAPSIATVNAVTGEITAVASGSATVTATYQNFTATCEVTVPV